jgi:hypothetical protein
MHVPPPDTTPQYRPRASLGPDPREETRDDRPDARDPRRVWARLLPRQGAFRNPAAQLLAEFSNAVLSEDGWEAWVAAHPDADELPAELRP